MRTNSKTFFGVLLISALVMTILVTVTNADLPVIAPLKETAVSILRLKITLTRTPVRTGAQTLKSSSTPVLASLTPSSQPSSSPTALPSATPTELSEPSPTSPPIVTTTPPVATPVPPTLGPEILPFPGAPLCVIHSNDSFHTLWNSQLGCHYNHEHGQDPFTQDVAAAFPGFDLLALLCDVEIGHCNPSSPMENTHKHGGFKWDVVLDIPCEIFEGANYCVTAAAVQYHAFGDSSIELESRVHSALALLKACDPSNLSECGYAYIPQHVDYGQRVSQYQGDIMPYTEADGCVPEVGCQANPVPEFGAGFGPYNTIDRYGDCAGCRPSLAYVVSRNLNANGVWTSKNTGSHAFIGSNLFAVLFRVRDMYQLKDNADNAYPFTFGWVCSSNGGVTYNPAGCRWNNSTGKIHEAQGVIPATWDNLAGFDTNPAAGRITASGFVTRFGNLNQSCTEVGPDCFPIKLVDMFVGKYGAALPGQKVSNPSPISNPERDLYFCAGVVCSETSAGAVPSGWIGPEN